MSGQPPLSSAPMDPYEWRESVLSTRSLSYLSQADAFGSQSRQSSNAHMFRPPTRRSTLDSMDEGLELFVPEDAQHVQQRLEDINEAPALPMSVAKSLLFTLPREIRDRVYTYCLSVPSTESLEWPTKAQMPNVHMLAPQLLRTCKLISAEALPVLYSSNTLSFSHPSDANMFVRAMASSIARSKVTRIFLVVKATDQSIWATYLHSTDKVRSLKEDFPALRELTIRYASNKWQHTLPVESNLRHWNDDGRLNSIINGITNVYFPHHKSKPSESNDASESLPDASPPREISFKQRLQELRRFQAQTQISPSLPPTMKIICACRIHSAQFAALTGDAPLPLPQAPAQPPAHHGAPGNAMGIPPPPPPPPALPGNITGLPLPGVAALLDGVLPVSSPNNVAVQEGEEFRGFTHADFKGRATKVLRDGRGGEKEYMQLARSAFARKGKVLLALEVFAADSTS